MFKNDQDRETILKILARVNKRYHWLCHAYCLMDNHYHLLIETPDGNLSIGMRQLNGVYTQARNKRYSKTGHLFQGRYKAILIQKDTHLLEVCRYVVLNPIRAGMVEKPEDWRWTSYRATAGKAPSHPCITTDWILGQFSRTRSTAEKEYRQFVHSGIGKETIWNDVKGQAVLGEDTFVDSLAGHLKRHRDIPEIPKSQRYANRPPLDKIFSEGILKNTRKRDKKITEAVEKYGYTQRVVADHLGMHFTYVSQIINRHQHGPI
ncbi:MAG: transposase [Nitrospirae bacterium]|nr:transposase [Nitrospirota bacterium]